MFKHINQIFEKKDLFTFKILFFLNFLMFFLEFLGIGSIPIFIATLISPEFIIDKLIKFFE